MNIACKGVVFLGLIVAILLATDTAQATNFGVLLRGNGVQSNIDAIRVGIEDIDLAGLDSEGVVANGFRGKLPGATRFPHIVLKRGVTKQEQDPLHVWWRDIGNCKGETRDLVVTVFDDTGEPSGEYGFLGCVIDGYSVREVPNADGTITSAEEFVFSSSGFSMSYKGKGASVGKPNPGKLTFVDEDGQRTTDKTVTGWSGGEPALILTPLVPSSDFHTTAPGSKLVTDITLKLPFGQPSEAISKWINDAVSGKPWKRSLIITELRPNGKPGKTYTYHDCFPIRYSFPKLSKDTGASFGTDGLVISVQGISF